MKVYVNPDRNEWPVMLSRPYVNTDSEKLSAVRSIMQRVRTEGDLALREYTLQFDGVAVKQFRVDEKAFTEAELSLPVALKHAIRSAAENIRRFHAAQQEPLMQVETMPGVKCWRRSVAIQRVGLYVPGGTAPLFSTVLMLGIPAVLAGCTDISICTPPQMDGSVHPAILYAAQVAGVSQVFAMGGAQAIAALAYGTESIPQVYKLFGPGNQYVTLAKMVAAQDGVAIDMPAGPSEVCVMADEDANASFVAADLLSQAEHGTDSQVLLIATNESFVNEVLVEIEKQLESLPRKDIAQSVLTDSCAVVLDGTQAMVDMVNAYAPEHLIIQMRDAERVALGITNAGSVFIGKFTPESAGDYASGTNHTLPTNGYARAYSGVSLDSFMKKITYQQITAVGLRRLGPIVETMAEAELLQAHSNAVRIRLNTLSKEGV